MPNTRRRRADHFCRDTIAARKESDQTVPAFCPARGDWRVHLFRRAAQTGPSWTIAERVGLPHPERIVCSGPGDPRPGRRDRRPRRSDPPRPGLCRAGRRRPIGPRVAGCGVLTLGLTGRIWICTTPRDGRKSFDGLQAGGLAPGQGGLSATYTCSTDGGSKPPAVRPGVAASIERHGLDPWPYRKHLRTELAGPRRGSKPRRPAPGPEGPTPGRSGRGPRVRAPASRPGRANVSPRAGRGLLGGKEPAGRFS